MPGTVMLAEVNVAGVLLLALGALFLVASVAALRLRGRARGAAVEIPRGLRPGPSDAALETPLLQKLQGWGVLLVAFFVVWFPATWLFEPDTNLDQDRELLRTSIERGSRAVLMPSEDNQLGVGCVRCHGPELRGTVIQSGAQYVATPNLTTVCGGPNTGHAAIFSQDDIYQVIREGRGVMPSWSIRFQGALNDQQINDIVNYLVTLSSKNVPFDQNVCLNEDASTKALDANEAAGSPINPRDP